MGLKVPSKIWGPKNGPESTSKEEGFKVVLKAPPKRWGLGPKSTSEYVRGTQIWPKSTSEELGTQKYA